MPLHLVRHAEADPGESRDPSLSTQGVAQAQGVAGFLMAQQVESIVHGPARRARQTAELLAAEMGGLPTVESARARDRTPWPLDEDLASLAPDVAQWFDGVPEPERDPGGRELERSLQAWIQLGEESSIAVVTHAFVVAWIAARIVGGPWDAWLRMPVDNATVTTVERGRRGDPWLRRFNSRG